MLTACERRLIFTWLSNAAESLRHHSREAQELAEWVTENDDLLALDDRAEEPGGHRPDMGPEGGLSARRRGSRTRTRDLDSDGKLSAKRWRRLREALERGCTAASRARGDRTARRLRRLGRAMRLSRTDVSILEIMLRYRTQPIIESMMDAIFEDGGGYRRLTGLFNARSPALSRLLGVSAGTILRRLAPDAPLARSGLVSIESDGDFSFIDRLRRLALLPGDTGPDTHRLLLDPAAPNELEWSDFDHLAEQRDHVERILKGALRARAAGVNVLVYGPPGTGKTEFCATLAARLGATLYSVGESDEYGNEPSRRERLQELRLAQRLLAPIRGSILLFDEMEDLLSDPDSTGWMSVMRSGRFELQSEGSKVFMNRLIEQAPAPTLWTSNSARRSCPTILRRMTFALELRQPPPRVRERVWARHLARHGIEAGAEDARSLAAEFDVTPGVASGATTAARLAGGDLDAVRRGVRSLSRVLSGERPPRGTPERFDSALIRADVDPVGLADSLAGSGARRFSLCLQGPSGTGKSAFVRHLAGLLGFEVVQKRASDLMSMWVGGTERQIAAAFAEARDAESFLVFDEADSLLADRHFAVRSWEVSQVNEMLTWMESHPLPFACTTNFGEHLDPATLRRFTFKVALDYLAPEQAMAAFRAYFALTPPSEVSGLAALTPGDFAVVRRQAEVLGRLEDPKTLAAMLRAECEAKPNRPRRMGFVG